MEVVGSGSKKGSQLTPDEGESVLSRNENRMRPPIRVMMKVMGKER